MSRAALHRTLAGLALSALSLAGCADDGAPPAADVGVDAPVADAVSALCADAPVLTWANFGDGFVRTYCQACHASDSANRRDAPPEVSFDTAAEFAAHRERVAARVLADPPTMPPGGGVSDADLRRLSQWLECN